MQKDPFHFGNWPTCPMPWKIYQQVTSLPSLITYRRHSIHCWATKIEKKKWESTWQLIESRRAAKQGKVEEKTATREIYIAIKKNVWKDKIEYTVVLAIQTHLRMVISEPEQYVRLLRLSLHDSSVIWVQTRLLAPEYWKNISTKCGGREGWRNVIL